MNYHRIKVNHKILIIIFLAFLPQIVFPQTNFSFGPELGLSVTSRQQEKLSYLYYDNSELFISPLIGLMVSVEVAKWLNIKSGIQYEKVGYPTATTEPQEMGIKFSKICIPIVIDIPFEIKKVKPSFFVGYRPNLLLSGKYSFWGQDINLFSMEYPVKRYTGQFTTGLSIYIRNINITLSYFGGTYINFGLPYTFTNHAGGKEIRYDDCSFNNNELVLSFTYLFKSKKTTD